MRRIISTLLLSAFWLCSQSMGQLFDISKTEPFPDFVAPVITQGEKEIYASLQGYQARDYFESIFWFKRDPEPALPGNAFKKAYFERRQNANVRFGEGSIPGTRTARGRVYLLLGEPDDVTQTTLNPGSAMSTYQEVWHFHNWNLNIAFSLERGSQRFIMQGGQPVLEALERARHALIMDRAEAYRLHPVPIALPNVGSTKDIENLVLDDSDELDFSLTYHMFEGIQNQTQVYVGLTFHDASGKGMDLHLTAYDPYENKVLDFKKKIEVTPHQHEGFFVALEPDQYQMVLRLTDKDGRESVNRRILDVPRVGPAAWPVSSLVLSTGLRTIPVEGFTLPKMFVFQNLFLPPTNAFDDTPLDRLYLMFQLYGHQTPPDLRFLVDGAEVEGRLDRVMPDGDGLRVVASVSAQRLNRAQHDIGILIPDGDGSWLTERARFSRANQMESPYASPILSQAQTHPDLKMSLPANDQIMDLTAVALRMPPGISLSSMTVFLNDRPRWHRDRPPWRVEINPAAFSISGRNRIKVTAETNQGLLITARDFQPLRADESIKTRAVQVFFNAYDENLEFVSDLDLDRIKVLVDNRPVKPMHMEKLDEPITYCFLVDTSFSMRDSFTSNIKAITKLVDSIRPMDRGFFIAFSDNYHQYNQPTTAKGVMRAVANQLELQLPNPKYADRLYQENQTFVYDAVIASIHALLQYPGRKAIVLVSDGIGTEGVFSKNAMLSYARENEVVIYSLWVDQNPQLNDDETAFILKETGKGEKFARAIGLSRFFAEKDSRKNLIGRKVRQSSITEGILKILSEESGGFHYRIFKADRSLIQAYVDDIEKALGAQYMVTLNLPVSNQNQHVDVVSRRDDVNIRCKSQIKVRKTNPLSD